MNFPIANSIVIIIIILALVLKSRIEVGLVMEKATV